jgi:hypothetical protein
MYRQSPAEGPHVVSGAHNLVSGDAVRSGGATRGYTECATTSRLMIVIDTGEADNPYIGKARAYAATRLFETCTCRDTPLRNLHRAS